MGRTDDAGPRCPICGADDARLLYALPTGDIVRCDGCGTVRRANLVDVEAAHDLYDDAAYLETPYFEALRVGASRDAEPYLVYRRVLDRFDALGPGGSLLDVGCSYGAFLEMAEERGWRPRGVDLSTAGCEYARDHRGLDVFCGTLEEAAFPSGSMRAVTMWDVVEHLADPLATLREIRRVLEPGGTLMVFTINQRSLMNRIGGLVHRVSLGRWQRPLVLLYDIHHNFFFDRGTIADLLERADLEVVEFDWMDADIARWQNVPIPRLLALGSTLIDRAARLVGQPYRMIVYARR